ncbi:MAG: dephospho-CoA kinase [Lentisphaeraceae bacterium]|nr:dephospho-CoA kinase [Lentisphaeraceae bacterium]
MLVALTGGIGAGKSTVLKIFESLGAQVADTDSIVHKIYEEDKQLHAVLLDRWGQKVFKDSLPHRPAIAEIVFKNKQELEWLNSVMHPLVKNVIQSLDTTGLHLIAVPLLYEINWQSEFQKTISVWCDKDIQNERLLARGWKQDEVSARLSAQLHQDEKLTRSDFGIINNWSIDFLNNQCQRIYKLLQDKGPT